MHIDTKANPLFLDFDGTILTQFSAESGHTVGVGLVFCEFGVILALC